MNSPLRVRHERPIPERDAALPDCVWAYFWRQQELGQQHPVAKGAVPFLPTEEDKKEFLAWLYEGMEFNSITEAEIAGACHLIRQATLEMYFYSDAKNVLVVSDGKRALTLVFGDDAVIIKPTPADNLESGIVAELSFNGNFYESTLQGFVVRASSIDAVGDVVGGDPIAEKLTNILRSDKWTRTGITVAKRNPQGRRVTARPAIDFVDGTGGCIALLHRNGMIHVNPMTADSMGTLLRQQIFSLR